MQQIAEKKSSGIHQNKAMIIIRPEAYIKTSQYFLAQEQESSKFYLQNEKIVLHLQPLYRTKARGVAQPG
ncbi:MAG: hypothetical protein ACQES0_02565 [Bacteroidota bacterium]